MITSNLPTVFFDNNRKNAFNLLFCIRNRILVWKSVVLWEFFQVAGENSDLCLSIMDLFGWTLVICKSVENADTYINIPLYIHGKIVCLQYPPSFTCWPLTEYIIRYYKNNPEKQWLALAFLLSKNRVSLANAILGFM